MNSRIVFLFFSILVLSDFIFYVTVYFISFYTWYSDACIMYLIKRVVTRTVKVELHLALSSTLCAHRGKLQVEYGKK